MQQRRQEIPIGIVFSTTGAYATIGREMLDGALLAIEEINADASSNTCLSPQIVDPGGVLDVYRIACDDLLSGSRIRHLVGCYTSSSREEIIPTVEKYDALLWYPSHYEGFESCDNVIYGGAAPNQHVVPLAGWALPRYGHDIYCIGSNYVWPWETTRIMRELVETRGRCKLGHSETGGGTGDPRQDRTGQPGPLLQPLDVQAAFGELLHDAQALPTQRMFYRFRVSASTAFRCAPKQPRSILW